MKKFGEKLRTLRRINGITQTQISKILDVSQAYVVQLEKSQKTPNAAMIIKIAKFFEVSLDRLMLDELDLVE